MSDTIAVVYDGLTWHFRVDTTGRETPMKELLVKTRNPAGLDQTVNALGGVVGQRADGTYEPIAPEVYVVRAVSGDPGFLRFAITQQGYGEVVGERDMPQEAAP